MPVIRATLLPGYEEAVEARLAQRLSDATRSVIDAPAAGTTVVVEHASTYRRDDRTIRRGGEVRPVASVLVREFLDIMQSRDLDAAKRRLAPGFVMNFPGKQGMTELEQLIERSKGRYRSVSKVYERFDECWQGGVTVVYCFGTLEGQWLDGSSFSGIRFIDRFEVVDGLLTRQDVWNDLAESEALLKRGG
ncbi:MAG: hypothetical protein AB7P21_02810 [Lautropia sp.]